jgi:hypothetical protein
MNDHSLSVALEAALVQRNQRGMASLRRALAPGYLARAANLLRNADGPVLIGTGFPVLDTFETDGPAGAIALYQTLELLGRSAVIACGESLARALRADFTVLVLTDFEREAATRSARSALASMRPGAVLALERPGLAADGQYYNMRGENISARCECFDPFMTEADCPTVGIGDGGNEVGMGKITAAVQALAITPAATSCDELIVADVSNWGAYALAIMMGWQSGRDTMQDFSLAATLGYLSSRGSVDGVTRENTLTEDGLPLAAGEAVITALRQSAGFI